MSLAECRTVLQAELEQLLTAEAEIARQRRVVQAALLLFDGTTPAVDTPPAPFYDGVHPAANGRLGPPVLRDESPSIAAAPASPRPSGEAPPAPEASTAAPSAPAEGGAPGRRGGRQPLYDYAETARIAREAFAAGDGISTAVAAHYGISASTAKALLNRAQAAGHDVPRPGKGYAANIGATVRHRRADDLVPAKPVTNSKPEPRNADDLPAPADRPTNTWAPKPGEMVLACTDCDTVVPLRPALIESHCRLHHQRRASGIERTPTAYEPEEGAA